MQGLEVRLEENHDRLGKRDAGGRGGPGAYPPLPYERALSTVPMEAVQ